MTDLLSAPVMACVNITDYCNLNCKYCYAHNNNKIFMPVEKAVETVTELHATGVWQLVLGGGEPFLHPDVLEILRRILRKQIEIGIITNGTVLRRCHFDALSEFCRNYPGLLTIQVSIDGPTSGINDTLRGQGKKVFDAIDALTARGIAISTGTVIHNSNVRHVHEVIDTFYPKVKKFHFMELMPSYSVQAMKESCFADRSQVRQAYKKIRGYQHKYPDITVTLPDLSAVISDQEPPTLKCEGCTAAVTRLDINANGDILACNIADQSVIGNIHRESIASAWRSEAADNYRYDSMPICVKDMLLNKMHQRQQEYSYPISLLRNRDPAA